MFKKNKILVFILGLLILLLLSCYLNYKLESKIYHEQNLRFAKPIKTIICGSSRLQTINPAWIKNSANISAGGQTFFYTYHALRKALRCNPSVQNIVLSFSYDNLFNDIPEQNDSVFYYQPKDLENYLGCIPTTELFRLNYYKPSYYRIWLKKIYFPLNLENNIKLLLTYKLGRIDQDNIPFYSNYYTSYQSNLNPDDQKYISKLLYKHSYSKWSEKWYYEILNLCKNKGLKVFIVIPPIHPKFMPFVPKEKIETFNLTVKQTIKNYKNLIILNYNKDNFPDSYYGDWHHLNSYGAPIIAKKIEQEILKR